MIPVLRAILAARPDTILSIDTYHAETVRMAVEAGAEIVNDVSGHLWDAEVATTCAELRCGVVLMHTRGRPQEWRTLPALNRDEVMPMVMRDLDARAQAAMAAADARFRGVVAEYPLRSATLVVSVGDFDRGGSVLASSSASIDVAWAALLLVSSQVTLHSQVRLQLEPWRSHTP